MKKQLIPFLLFALMLGGLFFSRALLSITQGAWVVFALLNRRSWQTSLTRDPLFIWACIPLLLFFTGCWQQPSETANYDYLLTLTAYPATALAVRSVSQETVQKYWLPVWGWATVLGLLYPLIWYVLHSGAATKGYGMGQSLPTFMDTDHVRFSIFLCAGFLFAMQYPSRLSRYHFVFAGVLFLVIIFLSVRTAWVILFTISVYLVIARYIFSKPRKLLSLLKIMGVFLIVSAAVYFLFPTVQQKIAYSMYDWQHFDPGKYDSDYSDGARRIVNHTAWQAIQHKDANVGWADIPGALQRSFAKTYTGTQLNYGWPFNQFLFWWLGSGCLGMILFSAWLLYPLIWGYKHKHHALVCWTLAIAAASLVESTLSLQYGVWLHIWPLAIFWQTKQDNVTS